MSKYLRIRWGIVWKQGMIREHPRRWRICGGQGIMLEHPREVRLLFQPYGGRFRHIVRVLRSRFSQLNLVVEHDGATVAYLRL